MTIVFAVTLLLTLLLWAGFVLNATSLHASDPAGNAMAKAFATLLGIAVWVLLAVLLLVAGAGGGLPAWAGAAALVLLPASFATQWVILKALSDDYTRDRWTLVEPIGVPLLIAAFAVCSFVPAIRAAIRPDPAAIVAWGAVLALTAVPWPVVTAHSRARDASLAEARRESEAREAKEQAARTLEEHAEWMSKLQKLPPDAPLWEWRDFTEHGDEIRRLAFEGMRRLKSRQADAEEMLARDMAFPMRELPDLDMEASPPFCEKARQFLRNRIKQVSPPVPDRPYSWEKQLVDPYLPAVEWLLGHGCDCGAEVDSLEAAVRAYPRAADRDQTLAFLARLRRPR